MIKGGTQSGRGCHMWPWYHGNPYLNLIPHRIIHEGEMIMRPMSPTVSGTQSQENESALNDLKDDARDLLRSAKQRMDMDGVGTILEKVSGGSGKGKTSSDLEGIAALIQATQGGANQTMGNAVGILTSLLSRQDGKSGSTPDSGDWLDKILKVKMIEMLFRQETQPQNNQMEAMMAYVTKIMEMQGLRFADYIEMTKAHNEWVISDLKERSGPDPLTAQLYGQWLPTIVSQSLGQANKDPVDHLLESADKLKKLGSLGGIFGNNNGGTISEKIQMRSLDLKEKEIFSNERQYMAKINAGHKKWKHIGDGLGKVFGNDGGGGANPLMTFAGMVQGLSQPGQPNGQGAM